MKPLPENQVYQLFKKGWNVITIAVKDWFPWTFQSNYSSGHPTAALDILFLLFSFFL